MSCRTRISTTLLMLRPMTMMIAPGGIYPMRAMPRIRAILLVACFVNHRWSSGPAVMASGSLLEASANSVMTWAEAVAASLAENAAKALNDAGFKAVSYVSPKTRHEFQTWRRSLLELAPLMFQD